MKIIIFVLSILTIELDAISLTGSIQQLPAVIEDLAQTQTSTEAD